MALISYNERSWAIDLASIGNNFAVNHLNILSAISGEGGVKVGRKTLFPDLLIHDKYGNILFGVELKFPDTQSDDPDLLKNMHGKAMSMGLNHGLSWNGNDAMLWKLEQNKEPVILKKWSLNHQISRAIFYENREETFTLFEEIMSDLEQFLATNRFRSIKLLDAVTGNIILRFVELNRKEVAIRINRSIRRSGKKRRDLLVWWHSNSGNWPKAYEMEDARAESILYGWFSRLLAGHLFCSEPKYATLLDRLNNVNPEWAEYQKIFSDIRALSNLDVLFDVNEFDTLVGNVVLNDIHELNLHLGRAIRKDVKTEIIHGLYHKLMTRGLRKSIGQFSTPAPLSRLILAHSLPDDLSKEIQFIDPCCGKGTFPFEAISMANDRFDLQAVASDKFRLPIMLTMLRFLTHREENIGIYETDLFGFGTGIQISSSINDVMINSNEEFDWICFNPPFVRQEHVDDALAPFATKSSFSDTLSKRTDLAGYAVLHAGKMVKQGGKLAFIAPNSILNTDWGVAIIHELRNDFEISKIIRSVDEKWFSYSEDDSAELVCVSIVLTKRVFGSEPRFDEKTEFITQKASLASIDSKYSNEELINAAMETSLGIPNDLFTSTMISWSDIEQYRNLGIGINSIFEPEFEILLPLFESLTPAHSFLGITRGERRGWNPLFYPDTRNCDIELNYLRPLIKSPKEVLGLTATPYSIAFCCSKTKEELTNEGHLHALNWIESFEEARNNKGELLPSTLERRGLKWYEIADSSYTDFVMMMNAGERHFVARCPEPSIVDQRFIRLNAVEDFADSITLKCLHAIMNSSLTYLYFESIGFGRGQGALDLNPTLIKKFLRVFNPNQLDEEQKCQLVSSFAPLLERDVCPIHQEINMPDRIQFENLLMNLYDVADKADVVRSLLLRLVTKRVSAAGR